MDRKVSTRKSVATKKGVAKKTPIRSSAPRVKTIAARQTKTQILADLAQETELEKKQVESVFAALGRKIEAHIKPRGSGEITIPDTGIKIARVTKPRTKARMGRNPGTGEAIKIAAKPARKAIRLTGYRASSRP